MSCFFPDLGRSARRWWAPITAAGLLVVVMLSPREAPPARLRFSPGTWPGGEPLVLAYDSGDLPKARFQLVELPWSSAVMRALGNGAADVAVVSLDSVLRMREAGQRLRVLMVLDESRGGDALIANSRVESLVDLRGRRVGVDLRGTGSYLLVRALAGAGLKLEDVQLVPMMQAEMPAAIEETALDAVVAGLPWLERLRQPGWRVLYDTSMCDTPVYRVLAASERACEAYPGEIRLLIESHKKWSAALRMPGGVARMEVVLRREKLTGETFERTLGLWSPVDDARNRALLKGAPPPLAVVADQIAREMRESGLLQRMPDQGRWIDSRFFEEVTQ